MGNFMLFSFAPVPWNTGMVETGDPLAGTERNELRAKNSGTLVVKLEKYR